MLKEELVQWIIDNQIFNKGNGQYVGHEFIKNKTEGLKLKIADLETIKDKILQYMKEEII